MQNPASYKKGVNSEINQNFKLMVDNDVEGNFLFLIKYIFATLMNENG